MQAHIPNGTADLAKSSSNTSSRRRPDEQAPALPTQQEGGAEEAPAVSAQPAMVKADAKAELMAAFAGDDVVAEFEKEKEEAVKESVDGIEDVQALKGWGTWASSKREPRCVLLLT